jgi:hypothetical protein
VIAAGEALLAPSVTRRLIADFVRRQNRDGTAASPQARRLTELTPREEAQFPSAAVRYASVRLRIQVLEYTDEHGRRQWERLCRPPRRASYL